MRKTIFVLLILVIPTSVFSEWGSYTGDELVESCRNAGKFSENKTQQEQSIFGKGVCLGYLHGIRLMLNRTDINYPPEFPKSCIPNNIMQMDLVNAIYVQANATPHMLKSDASTLVVIAWSKLFPCNE